MKSLSICSSLLLFFTLSVTLISQSANAALIDEICDKVEKDKVESKINCMNIAKLEPRIMLAKNNLELSRIVLGLAVKKGIEGQAILKGIALKNKSHAIAQCANFAYDGVVGSFRSALGELKEDAMTANYDTMVASDGPNLCERALADEHIVNPVISSIDKQIIMLSIIASRATDKL